MEEFQKLQETMADTAAEIVDEMLDPWWTRDRAPVVSQDAGFKEEKLPLTRMLGEEFAALVYVNFLITVLLRMRTLVVTAIGMFVFIVLSMNVYPLSRIRRCKRWQCAACCDGGGGGVCICPNPSRSDSEPLDVNGVGRVGMGLLAEVGVGRRDSGLQFAGGSISRDQPLSVFLVGPRATGD